MKKEKLEKKLKKQINKVVKYFLCSCYVLLFVSTSSFAMDIGELVLRDGVYYEQFSNITYTGWGEEKCTGYYHQGKAQFSGAIENGIKNGVWNKYNCGDYSYKLREEILYYEGRITRITEYHDEECQVGRYSWNTVVCKKEERSYDRNDQLTGVFTSYHRKPGLIKITGNYRNGKKNGLWNENNSSGVLISKGSYNLDKKEGVWEYFFYSGM
ncbi:uncharacterized protein METZ01_LOCUS482485, partial [marine metagenome]